MDEQFAEYVRARYTALVRTAYLLTGDQSTAEELVQESLAKLWLTTRREFVENPDAYMRTVMVNGSVSRWRRLRPWDRVQERAAIDPAVDDSSTAVDDRDHVWQALLQLPARQRAILVLRFYEDLSEAEICQTLSISPGTVRSQTFKARERLRNLLAETEGAPL